MYAGGCLGGTDSQPEEEREARDVQVPLGSEQLHVQVVKHARVELGIFAVLHVGILSDFSHGI